MLLTAENLHKTYTLGRVEVPVLHGASVSVRKGEFVAILGASGSGKSTLLHLLGGLDTPDRKSVSAITFDGTRLDAMGAAGLNRYRSRDVGFVFQFFHLLPELTVLQNVTIAGMVRLGPGYFGQRRAVRRRGVELLETFGLGHRLKHRPSELSGGERQRVAIARALVNDPAMLLADEPTGNLDSQTGQSILDALQTHREQSGQTMVMVTHDPVVAGRADRTIRLVDGVIAQDGGALAAQGADVAGST